MNLEQIINTLKNLTATQWTATIGIVVGILSGIAYIDSKYAARAQQELLLENVMRIDSKLTAIINTQYGPEQAAKIQEQSKLYEEQMRRYLQNKP